MKDEKIEVECNECDWKGKNWQLRTEESDPDIYICPDCYSSNLYFFKEPLKLSDNEGE